jgi:ABC-type branched-subunit amino acid transport system substrate-binding protein
LLSDDRHEGDRPITGEQMPKSMIRRARGAAAVLALLGLTASLALAPGADAKAKKKTAKKTTRKTVTTKKQATATTVKAAPSGPKGTIKIGQLYTKINGTTGAATLNEAFKIGQAWEEDVNGSGGINGYKVDVVAKEFGADTARAVAGVKELDKAGVLAIAGSEAQASLPALVGYLNDKQLPYVAAVPYADEVDWDPMVFATGASEYAGRYGQVAAARDAGAKKFMNAYCAEVAACAGSIPVTAEAARREGMQHVSQSASAVATDYTAVCISAKNQNVDFFQSNGLNFANVIRDCSRQNYHPTYAQGGVSGR